MSSDAFTPRCPECYSKQLIKRQSGNIVVCADCGIFFNLKKALDLRLLAQHETSMEANLMAGELPQSYDSWKTEHEFSDDYEDEAEYRIRRRLPRAGSGLTMPCTLDEFMDQETEQRRGNGKLPVQVIDKV